MADRSGKTDMERVGLFQEMNYATIGDKYKSTAGSAFNEAAGKGKQLLPGGAKVKAATQAGYFTDKFGRVFDGESYSDPIQLRRRYRLEQAKKNLSKPFLPSNGDKKMSGLGSFYGTFTGPVPAFSPIGGKGGKTEKTLGKNILTNPGKHGTGYGYVGVTLGKYPNNLTDAYDNNREMARKVMAQHKGSLKGGAFRLNMHPTEYFDGNPFRTDKALPPVRKTASAEPKDVKPFKPSSPGKLAGGGKVGTFDPYPSHSADPYSDKMKRPINVVNKTGKIFMPSPGPKSRPMNSIMDQNIVRSHTKYNPRLDFDLSMSKTTVQ
ncbi:cilia-and flagella-associated protein 96-like isoform X2 [Littorina saxatilis]|uniref:Cilia-and flagella-associated protein 96 n=1 Tax=Littorina saxatilis TaxID=31220 RepID=A0AAN9BVN5_9CAEN